MKLIRIDTQRAYEIIREKITSLELSPGSPLDEGELAKELQMGLAPVREALNLLTHDHLVDPVSGGLSVSKVDSTDLKQISEIRLLLEPFCARQAANRAEIDDIIVLEALCQQQSQVPADQKRSLFDLDHKFHQAIARAARNQYLSEILEDFYGQSKRLWFMALPQLEFLPAAIETHIELVEAIKNKDGDTAAKIMGEHIQSFYDKVYEIIKT